MLPKENQEIQMVQEKEHKVAEVKGLLRPEIQVNLVPCNRRRATKKMQRTLSNQSDAVYQLDDIPPWYLCVFLGLQHYLTMFGGTVAYPYILTPKLCMRDDDPARGYVVATTFFVSGLATLLQATFGIRLPIVQSSPITFLAPTLAILSLPEMQCPTAQQIIEARPDNDSQPVTDEEWRDLWQSRMRVIQGGIIAASLMELMVGLTGLIGFLLRWISPLAIVPTMSLIGLSLFEEATAIASGHWGVAFATMVLMIIFSQYMSEINVPCLGYSKRRKCHFNSFPLFKLFPVLLTIFLVWSVCAILTVTDVFPPMSPARTDLRMDSLRNSPWFRVPYPGQWGTPIITASAVLGILSAILASIIESVGDYYVCSRLAGAPPPPTHAVNRGIFMEGVGCVLAGLWGSGNGLSSYSENVGAIGVTKVASRRVIQVGGVIMMSFGLMSKCGALFVTVPEPIVGGLFCVVFAFLTAAGLSNLQHVNLNSARNLFILGTSLFMGLCIPKWLRKHTEVIDTGSELLDQILTVLGTTSIFVGGFLGFFLDNTVPGTDEERGVTKWRQQEVVEQDEDEDDLIDDTGPRCYDLPCAMSVIQRTHWLRYVPISPTYRETTIARKLATFAQCLCSKKEKSLQHQMSQNVDCSDV